jgi:hypothetical protein
VSIDVVIAGRGGFIGTILAGLLEERELAVAEVREFAAGPERAAVLVNLANVAEDPAADRRLLDQRIGLVGGRVGHWLQVQSFITLHGRGGLDLGRFNAGFAPVALDRYGVGKLAEERRLLEAAATGAVGPLTFAYLPAVLDRGGAWDRARAQAREHGYVLPGGMRPSARANFTYVVDLADLVCAWVAAGERPPVSRVIVNDPLSRTTTWPDLLGPTATDPDAGAAARLKAAARLAKGRASALGFAAAASVGRLGPPAREPAPPAADGPVLPSGPLEFHTALRYLVRRQPFLPPTPYRRA